MNPKSKRPAIEMACPWLAMLLAVGAGYTLFHHMSPQVEPSPDGRHALTTYVERDPARQLHYLCIGLRVTDADGGGGVWEHRTRATARAPYQTGWDASSRRVWLQTEGRRSEFDPFAP